MFERYNEPARRALFFARFETSQLGSLWIETEHVLLGLTRDTKGIINTLLERAGVSVERLRSEIKARCMFSERVSTSVEIPFTEEVKRVLQFAAEEADRLMHTYVGPEHMLLGVLREQKSMAAGILASHGLRAEELRAALVNVLNEPASGPARSTDHTEQTMERIEQVKQRVGQLGEMSATNEARALAEGIRQDLDALREHIIKGWFS